MAREDRSDKSQESRFVGLLAELCRGVAQPVQKKGRPRLLLSDKMFASVYKVYCGFSSRRFAMDLRDAQADGLISKTQHFNSVSNYLSDPALMGILKKLVTIDSLPLKVVETDFAVDSSDFSTGTFVRWFDRKYEVEKEKREWFEAHLIVGVKTDVVTGVDVSGHAAHDNWFLAPGERHRGELHRSGGRGGQGVPRSPEHGVGRGLGGTPFIPFKSGTVEPKGDSVRTKMYHYFAFSREGFLDH